MKLAAEKKTERNERSSTENWLGSTPLEISVGNHQQNQRQARNRLRNTDGDGGLVGETGHSDGVFASIDDDNVLLTSAICFQNTDGNWSGFHGEPEAAPFGRPLSNG